MRRDEEGRDKGGDVIRVDEEGQPLNIKKPPDVSASERSARISSVSKAAGKSLRQRKSRSHATGASRILSVHCRFD
jgi:hypothetical protein